MIKMNLGIQFARRLGQLAERGMNSSHWGGDAPLPPEYQILSGKLNSGSECIELTVIEAELLVQWIIDGTRHGRHIQGIDPSLFESIALAYRRFLNENPDEADYRLRKVESSLKKLEALLPATAKE